MFRLLDLLTSNKTIPVTLANHVEDSFTVELPYTRIGTSFEVTGDAAGGGKISLTERARDIRAAVSLRLKMLLARFIRIKAPRPSGGSYRPREAYYLQAVLILKSPVTISAVVPVVILTFYMLICGARRMEL